MFRISGFGLRIFLLFFALSAAAQPSNQIPDLKPPQQEIPPSFWDAPLARQRARVVVPVSVGVIIALAAGIWHLTRRKTVPPEPPAAKARRELKTLTFEKEDEALVSEVSRIFRRYVQEATGLGRDELTTEQVDAALAHQTRVTHELLFTVTNFLRECDARKFAPVKPLAAPGLVDRALDVITWVEARPQTEQATLKPGSPAAA